MDAAASAGSGATGPDGRTLPFAKGLQFGVLGPLVAFRDGSPVALGGPKERLVLAYLLAHANAPVSTDSLVDAVWGDAPPRSAERTLQAYMSRLRRAIDPTRSTGDRSSVLPRSGGYYRLLVPRDRLDALRFEDMARLGAAQVAGNEPAAVETLTAALALWRGDPYGDFAHVESCAGEARRLNELRLCAVEDLIDAELAAGAAAALVAQLEAAVDEQPFRERRWGQLMMALYRAGRQRDALATYQRARRILVDELGIEPGSALRHLEAAMLDQDPGLDQPRPLEGSPHGALPAALGSVGPTFVGRAGELAWLRGAWSNALEGLGGFVSVLGPEGMGKTRLVAELAREVQREGAIVLYGRCDHAHRGATALLDQMLRSGGASLAAVDVPADELAAATLRYLSTWSAGHPVLIVLDDLHLADADTLEVVADLAGWSAAGPTLIVAAFRSELNDLDLDRRDGLGTAQISLGGLDPDALRELCDLYGPDLWSACDLERLRDLTNGVPLLVHEHAGAWAKERVAGRVEEAAARSKTAHRRLAASRHDVADGVEGIQRLSELLRANLAGREAELRAGQGLEPCPYKGLATFEAADADNFFGRERLVAELVARLAEVRMLAVVGPSGSGKSSLVRAGLVPALAAGALPVEGGWQTVVLTPGVSPARSLHEALVRAEASTTGRRLVFVDQLEETFTQCRDATDRVAFAEALTELAERADTVVVLAVRADQLGRCAELTGIADLISGNEVLVGPMRESELGRAIELPARRAGLSLDRGLAEIIVGDVAGRAGALPLLSTALAETWERRDNRTLTLAGYRAAGGVNGALAHLAEDTYTSLDRDGRIAARRVLMRLCDAGDDGPADLRRRLPLSDVVIDGDTTAAVERLVERRLVIVDRDTIEVAHEAILREWPRLAAWLDEDVQGRRLHRHLGDTAAAWRVAGQDPSELYRGTRLEGALEWADAHPSDLNASERTFLDASRAAAEHEAELDRQRLGAQARANRRLRALLAGVAVLLVVALVSGVLFLHQRDRAEGAARSARARELAGKAILALDEDPELATLLALQAVSATDTPTADAIGALQAAVQTSRLLVRAELGARYVDVTEDGSLLVTASSSDPHVAIVWDTATWTPLRSLSGPAEVQRVTVSPDGTRLAVGYDASALPADQPGVIVWNPGTGAVVDVLAGEGRLHSPTDFSPDGRLLAVVSTDPGAARLTVRDPDAHADQLFAEAETFGDATFSSDSRSVLVAEPTAERISRYPVGGGRPSQVIATPGLVPDMMALHPFGRLLAVSSQVSQAAELWDVETGQRRWSVEAADGGELSWSPRGDRLAISGTNESRIRVVDPDSGDDVSVLQGHASGSWGVAYLPDGERLASVGYTGDLRIWDVSPDGPPELHALAPSAAPHSLVFSPNGTAAIVVTWGGTVERFATTTDASSAALLSGLVSELAVRPVISLDSRRVGSVQQGTGQTLIRDVATLETVAELPLCSNPMALSPDASLVLLDGRLPCTSDLGAVPRFQPTAASVLRGRVVDVDSGREILDLGERVLLPGAFSPDGRYLAVVARTTPLGALEIYDLTTRELISSREFSVGPFSLAFDPQSRWLAGGMEDGSVWVLDLAAVVAGTPQEGAVVFEKAAHHGGVVGLDVSGDGVVATAARGEASVRLWDIESGKRLLELSIERDPAAYPLATFSPDDRFLLYLDGAIIRRYDRDIDALIELARNRLTRGFTDDECRDHLGRSTCATP